LTSVTGSNFAGVTNYVTGIKYRAWGAPKQATYGSGHTATSTYSPRMQIQQYDLPGVMGATYAYNPDKQIKTMMAATDANPTGYDRRMDRSFLYDHAGRTIRTRASDEAGLGGGPNFLFRQDYSYDAFGNMTSRGGAYWPTNNGEVNGQFNWTYTNNRATTVTGGQTWTYDGMGYLKKVTEPDPINPGQTKTLQNNVIDAVGRIVESSGMDGAGQVVIGIDGYYLRSRVFGGQIVTTIAGGEKSKTRVYVGEGYLAEQLMFAPSMPDKVLWHFRDPLNAMSRDAGSDASLNTIQAIDSLGVNVMTTDGINLNWYYDCLRNPGGFPYCSDFHQPPSFYTPPSAYGASASGSYSVKVDGALTIYSVGDIMAMLQRQGIGATVWISPSLNGTPLTQGLSGSFVRRTGTIKRTIWETYPGNPAERPRTISVGTYDFWCWVPGGEPDPQTQTPKEVTTGIKNFFGGGWGACRGVINEALKSKGTNIDDVIANAKWNEANEKHPDWNKKLSELGFTKDDFSDASKLDMTLGEYFSTPRVDPHTRDESYALGITNPRRNGGKGEIWIGPRNASQRGVYSFYTYFHEGGLHLKFGTHAEIVKTFGIPEYYYTPDIKNFKITDHESRIDKWVVDEKCGTEKDPLRVK
jgi:hypothetical protein